MSLSSPSAECCTKDGANAFQTVKRSWSNGTGQTGFDLGRGPTAGVKVPGSRLLLARFHWHRVGVG
eukprot:539961-Rhodomonas_salina.1